MHDNITTDINTHLAVLMADLKDLVCQWRELGLQLGLNYFKLREIETNRREGGSSSLEISFNTRQVDRNAELKTDQKFY